MLVLMWWVQKEVLRLQQFGFLKFLLLMDLSAYVILSFSVDAYIFFSVGLQLFPWCHYRDKLALKAVSDGSASYAALEKKAELYEKLARGELPDEEDNEKYCVDFFRKGQDEDGVRNLQANASSSCKIPEMENGEYDDFIPFHSKPIGLGRTTGIVDIDEHKRFVRLVAIFRSFIFIFSVFVFSEILFFCDIRLTKLLIYLFLFTLG